MYRILSLALLSLLLALDASAAVIKTIQAGATDQTVVIKIIDSTDGTPETGVVFNTSGIDIEYWRHGANSVTDITEATQTVSGAHSDGGFVHLGNGYYRLDLPDAAVATGATAVEVMGTVTGMIVIGGTVDLSPPVNIVSYGGTAGTFASGRPEVNMTHIAGSAVSTSTAQLGVNIVNAAGTAWGSGAITAGSIATDAIGAAEVAADAGTEIGTAVWATTTRALTILDEDSTTLDLNATAIGSVAGNVTGSVGSVATGGITEASYATTAGSFDALGIVDQGTAQAATSTTLQLRSAAAFADDEIIGATILVTGGSAGVGQSRTITDYVSSTDTATVATWTTTPTGTITYEVFGTAASTGGGGSLTAADVWGYGSRTLTALDEDSTTIDLDASTVAWNSAWDAEVESEVDDALGGGTGTALTSIPWNAAWDAEVQSEATDALNAYDPPTNAEMEARTLVAASYATAAMQATIAGYIDTEIQTLLSGVNVEQMNGNDVCGTGDAGTPWTGCP